MANKTIAQGIDSTNGDVFPLRQAVEEKTSTAEVQKPISSFMHLTLDIFMKNNNITDSKELRKIIPRTMTPNSIITMFLRTISGVLVSSSLISVFINFSAAIVLSVLAVAMILKARQQNKIPADERYIQLIETIRTVFKKEDRSLNRTSAIPKLSKVLNELFPALEDDHFMISCIVEHINNPKVLLKKKQSSYAEVDRRSNAIIRFFSPKDPAKGKAELSSPASSPQ